MTDALGINGLTVRRGRRTVLQELQLSVAVGEIVAVLGPNGSGKSTLVSVLSGLLRSDGGRIEHAGRVAAVMQTPGLARRSARANVELALAWWGVPRGRRRVRAEAALTLMHADHLARRQAHTLSGGERRRVHLARAVAVAPDVLLLDEPFDGLDPQTHDALREDTAAALREAGRTALAVVHDRADAWAMADRIAVLLDGRIRAIGTPQDVLDNPPDADVARFLGYDGTLERGGSMLLTRAAHVRVAPGGDLPATVLRRVGVEDGHRLELRTPHGTVWGLHFPTAELPSVRVGDEVRLRVSGGVEFPADASATRAVADG